MSDAPPSMRCSWMDIEHAQMPCQNPARWACRVDISPWMMGVWLCDDHKPVFEAMLPVLDIPGQGRKVVPVGGILLRSPLILHLDYLATGQQGSIPPAFKCDICDQPIIRNYEKDIWQHVDMGIIDHPARVG